MPRFGELAPEVSDWTEILATTEWQAGRSAARYNPRDLSLILRANTEWFGSLRYPFAGVLGRQSQNWASELRNVRKRWAYDEELTLAETYRAFDSAEMLLRSLGADAQADRVRRRKSRVLTVMAAESGTTMLDQKGEDRLVRTSKIRKREGSMHAGIRDGRNHLDASRSTCLHQRKIPG